MATDRADLLYRAVKNRQISAEQLRDDDKALLQQYMSVRFPVVSQVTGEEGLPPIPQPSGVPGLIEKGIGALQQGYESRAQSNLEKMAQAQGITPQQLLQQAQQSYAKLPAPIQQLGYGAASGIVPKLTMPDYAKQQLAAAPQPQGFIQKASRTVGEMAANMPIYAAVGSLVGAPAAKAASKLPIRDSMLAADPVFRKALQFGAGSAATLGTVEAVRQAVTPDPDRSIEDLVRAIGQSTVLGGLLGAGAGVLSWYVPQLITAYRTNRDLGAYRKVLGVGKDATPEQIDAAYKALSKKLHPDVNPSPNAQQQFIELNEARDILKHWPMIDRVLYDAGDTGVKAAQVPPVFDPSRPVPALRQPVPTIPTPLSMGQMTPRPYEAPAPIGTDPLRPPSIPMEAPATPMPRPPTGALEADVAAPMEAPATPMPVLPTSPSQPIPLKAPAKGRKPEYTAESPEVLEGIKALAENKAYIDNQGQYHVGSVGVGGATRTGPIAPWNKAFKSVYPTWDDAYRALVEHEKTQQELTKPEGAAIPRAEARLADKVAAISPLAQPVSRPAITKEMPVEQKVTAAGFRDVNEATMAFEARSLGKDKFLETFGEIDKSFIKKYFPQMKPQQIYDSLTQKVDSLDKDTQDIVAMDLQLFGGGQKFTPEERKTIRKMIDATKGLDLKHLRPEYREKVEGLLSEADWKVAYRTQRRMDRMQATADFLEAHPENSIPNDVLAELKLLDKKQLSEMTFDEIKTMFDAVRHAVKLNTLKNRLTIGKQLIEAKKVVDEAREAVVKARPEVAVKDANLIDGMAQYPVPRPLERVFTSETMQPESIVQLLQGGDEGPISKFLYDGIDRGVSKQLAYYWDTHDAIRKAIGDTDVSTWSRAFNLKAKNVKTVSIPVSEGRTLKITPDQRMEIYAHTLNAKNRASILEGGIIFSARQGQTFKITKADVDAVVKSMTADEKRIIDAMLEHFNNAQKKAINDESVKLLGYEIATEPDYWPIKRSWYSMEHDPLKAKSVFARRTLEGMGFLKERTGVRMPLVIRGAFATFYESISNAGAYAGLAEPLRNAKLILQDSDLIHSLRERGLGHYVDALNKYVEDVEGAGIGISDNVENALRQLLIKIQGGIVGFNPGIVAKQPVSYLAAATEIEWKYLLPSLFTRPNWEEITKYSSQMRNRVEGRINREAGELGELGRVLHFFTGRTFLSQKFTEGIKKFDLATVGRIWNAVKLEIRDKFPDLKGDEFFEKVAERADQIVNRTQPSGLAHTLSSIGRTKSFVTRALTVFSTQRNKNVNMIYNTWRRYTESEKTAQDKINFLKKMFILIAACPAAVAGIDVARDRIYQKKSADDPVTDFMWRTFTSLVSNFYFIGPAFSSLLSKMKKGTFAGFDIEDPVTSTANEMVDSVSKVFAALNQLKTQERYKSGDKRYELKWKDTAMKAADATLKVIAKTQGIPYGNVKNIIDAMIKAGENERRAPR